MSGHTSRPAALAPCSAYAAASAAGRQNAARTVISVLAVRSPQQVSTLAVVSRPIAGCRSSALPGRYGRLGPAIMQRENERKRLAVDDKRTDDGSKCTLLAVCETGGTWVLYLHGASQLGVRIANAEADKVAQAILAERGK